MKWCTWLAWGGSLQYSNYSTAGSNRDIPPLARKFRNPTRYCAK